MIIGHKLSRVQVERGIWNTIRKACVAAGNLPDRKNYATENLYNNAKEVLRATAPGNFIFEVYGVGSNRDRDGFRQNAFYVNEGDTMRGTIGGWKVFFEKYTNAGGFVKFKKWRGRDSTEDLQYEVVFSASNVHAERIMRKILDDAMDTRDYIPGLNEDWTETETFHIQKTNDIDLNDSTIFERKVSFMAMDIVLRDLTLLDDNVPPIIEIDAQIDERALEIIPGLEFSNTDGWVVLISVTEAGDLVYDNYYDPSTTFELVDGEIVASGPNAHKYSVNEEGNFIYTP